MKEIYSVFSQNGRWGISIVSESINDCSVPIRAEIMNLGRTGGQDVFRVEETEKPQWVLVCDDAEPILGASLITAMDLQGHRNVTVILIGPKALVRYYGYRRRSSRTVYYEDGNPMKIPESVLLAQGMAPASQEPEVFTAPPSFPDVKPDYKLNPLYIETKSKRLQLVLQPSLYERVKDAAFTAHLSVNEYIHRVLESAQN